MQFATPKKKKFIQTKLQVGEPNDAYEKEADQVADQVMRMPQTDQPIQRKCDHCEEEDLQMKPISPTPEPIQRKEGEEEEELQMQTKGGETLDLSDLENRLQTQSGRGQSLETNTLQQMEGGIGADFSQVKVHTDNSAIQMNRQLNAKAFTHGRDIYFNSGEYQPESRSGQHLLAHELTHVVQQGSDKKIQKADRDWQIRGIQRNTESFSERIFFDFGSTSIAAGGAEETKITNFLAQAGMLTVNLTLKGFASEEGSAAGNANTVDSRIAAVKAALVAGGHTGTITLDPSPSTGLGRIDYRMMRSVEIIPAGGTSSTRPAQTTVACSDLPTPGTTTYPGHLTDAITEAQTLIAVAITGLDDVIASAGTALEASTIVHLKRFFGNSSDVKAQEVKDRLVGVGSLNEHLGNNIMRTPPATVGHECVNVCSNSSGWNEGTGASAKMTLCPDFFSNNLEDRTDLLIHEGAHGTTNIGGDDHSYGHLRLIEFLEESQSIENPDSFVLFIRFMNGETPTVGRPVPDSLTGFTVAGEEDQAKSTIAWLETYLTQTYMQIAEAYQELNDHRDAGTTWSPGFYRNLMAKISTHFPEITAPPAVNFANRDDQIKVAAIHDRLRIMRNIFRHRTSAGPEGLNVTRAAGATSWQNGPGLDVTIGDDFIALNANPLDQVKFLAAKLVAATPDISAARQPKYVALVNDVRRMMSLPAPPTP